MSGIVLAVLGVAIKLGKLIAVPIKNQFNYLCCFNNNVQSLNEEAKKLGDERSGLEMEVTTAENDLRMIDPKVVTWLEVVNEIQEKTSELGTEISNIQGVGCLSVKSRYSLSKRAYKTAEAMKKKQEDRRGISVISHSRPPPASMVQIIECPTREFDSRKEIEENIMATLRDGKVKIMGICGMGGVGKTTLADKVMKRVREEKLFDELVMVVVSQNADRGKIQGEIAGNLGLILVGTNLSSRAKELCTRLMGGKRILIVLDDVWEYLNLVELGIPCKDGCSVLLTSRDRGVLARMDANPILAMKTLIEEEALPFFKERLGFHMDDQDELSGLAQEISKECNGLPLALVSVAGALKDQKNISCWKDALVQLKSSNPEDLSEVLKDVYIPLKLSYDYLSSQNARSIFLLCCLFPEDGDIHINYLAAYAIGLHMFQGIRDMEQVRNRSYSLIEMLKSRFLLLDCQDEGYVRMHDVVRDVAIFIASKEMQLIKCRHNSVWISPYLGERTELSKGSTYPNLRLLLVDESSDKEFQSSPISFEGMSELNVLSIRYDDSLRSLMHTTQFLKNLRTLILENCRSLKTICDVGELVNLEILICRHCDTIEKICDIDGPISDVSSSSYNYFFKNLKLLRLEVLPALKRLRKKCPNVVSLYSNLSSIYVVRCDRLVNLFPLSTGRDCFPQLETITIASCGIMEQVFSWKEEKKENEKNTAPESQQITITFPRLKCLRLWDLRNLKVFYQGIENIEWPLLTQMDIRRCPQLNGLVSNLHGICTGGEYHSSQLLCMEKDSIANSRAKNTFSPQIPTGSFTKLEQLEIDNFGNIRSLFSFSIAQKLGSLKILRIERCKKLVKVIGEEDEECSNKMTLPFPHLEELYLKYLSKLKIFCNWRISLEFPKLATVFICGCPEMETFNLGSQSTSNLKNLEKLQIWDCSMIEQVFMWSEKENGNEIIGQSRCDNRHITFPKLRIVELTDLPRLTNVFIGIESIDLPLLYVMDVMRCPNLEGLASATTSSSSGDVNYKVVSKQKEQTIYCSLSIWEQFPIDNFTRLRKLRIDGYDMISFLFSTSIAGNLINLYELKIESCKNLIKVIEDVVDESRETTPLFPRLEELSLGRLPKLKIFCEWRCALELPSLKRMRIDSCPEMERFSLGSLTTPNLNNVYIECDAITITGDLNDVLQQRFIRPNEEITLCENEDQKFEDETEEEIHILIEKIRSIIIMI